MCGLLLYNQEKSSLSVLQPVKTTFTGTVSDYPEEKKNSVRFLVKLNTKNVASGKETVRGSILLYCKKNSESISYMPGDILVFTSRPVLIINRGNPYEFDYRFFMENLGVRYYSFIDSADILKHISPTHRKIVHRALITRESIIQMFRDRGIKGEKLALVAAITLGQKRMLDQDQKNNFIKAGVMHIMAVSGLHAIILSLFVMNVLFFMKRKFDTLRIIITIAVLWAFAFVTGLTPSVLRATLMFSFLQAGKLIERPSNGLNSVLASAFFLIILKPSVIFDAGFLLSYSAVLFIICFYNDLYLLIHFKNWLNDKIWQSAAVTLVAQAGTLPLTIMLFNRFPVYFILANITIVPVSNLLIITGCLVPLFFSIQFLSGWLALLLNFLTGMTEIMTEKTASLPFSTIENIGLTTYETVFLSISIFLAAHYLLKKKTIPSFLPVTFIILFVLSGTLKNIFMKNTSELIVYNTDGSSVVGVRTGRTLHLFADSAGLEVKRHCAVMGLNLQMSGSGEKSYFIKAGSKKIMISQSLSNTNSPVRPDIIVFTGHTNIKNRVINRDYANVIIVTEGSGSSITIPRCAAHDSIYYIRKSGAFISRI